MPSSNASLFHRLQSTYISVKVHLARYLPIVLLAWMAPTDATENMIGWAYIDWYGSGLTLMYASDPTVACHNSSKPGGKGLDHMKLTSGDPGAIVYGCWLRLVGTKKTTPLLQVSAWLVCKTGYVPLFPGRCVKRLYMQPPPATSCSPNSPGFTVGNPVIVSNGSKVQQEIDLSGNQWHSLTIGRIYRSSRTPTLVPTADNLWSFSFERELRVSSFSSNVSPYSVLILGADGSSTTFNNTIHGYASVTAPTDALLPLTPTFDEWIHETSSGQLEYYKKFDSRFLLQSSTTKDGITSLYSYDDQGKLKTISDAFGRILHVRWNDANGVASIKGKDASVYYTYESFVTELGQPVNDIQRLIAVDFQDAEGALLSTKQYHYGDRWPEWFSLIGITDENNVRYANYSYDTDGRVTRSEHAGGADRYEFTYPGDSVRMITDPLGTVRTATLINVATQDRIASFSQPGGAGCGPAASTYAYSPDGTLLSSTDFNKIKTCFAYDATRHWETSHIKGIPAAMACPLKNTALTAGQRKVSTRWHPNWQLRTAIAEPLKITYFIYNGQPDIDGNPLTCTSAGTLPDGKPTAVLCKKIEQATTDANGSSGFDASTIGAPRLSSFSYNEHGQILSSTISAQTTRYEYYADSTASHTTGDLWKVTNPAAQSREFLEYTPAGLAIKIKEIDGQITALSYDARQHLTKKVTAAESAMPQSTTYSYDKVGQLIRVELPDSSLISYRYDDARRLTDITDTVGNTIHYSLDPMGNRIREEVRDQTGALRQKVIRVYDALNRIQAQTTGEL